MTPWSERLAAPADADGIVRLVRVAAYAGARSRDRAGNTWRARSR